MNHLLKFENYGKIPLAYYLPGLNVPKTVTINGGNKWQYNSNGDVGTNLGPTNEYDGIYTFAYGGKGPVYQCGQQEILHGGNNFGPSEDPTENDGYGLMFLFQDVETGYYIEISEVSDNKINASPISITISNFTSDNENVTIPDGTVLYGCHSSSSDIAYMNETITLVPDGNIYPSYNNVITTINDIEVSASFNAKLDYIELNSPFVVLLKDSLPMSFEVQPTRSTNGNIVYEYIGKNNKDSNGNTINGFYVYYNQANNYYRILNDRASFPDDATNVTYGGYTFHYYNGEDDKFIYYPDPLTDYVPEPVA